MGGGLGAGERVAASPGPGGQRGVRCPGGAAQAERSGVGGFKIAHNTYYILCTVMTLVRRIGCDKDASRKLLRVGGRGGAKREEGEGRRRESLWPEHLFAAKSDLLNDGRREAGFCLPGT